jgi:hypothetical protein
MGSVHYNWQFQFKTRKTTSAMQALVVIAVDEPVTMLVLPHFACIQLSIEEGEHTACL